MFSRGLILSIVALIAQGCSTKLDSTVVGQLGSEMSKSTGPTPAPTATASPVANANTPPTTTPTPDSVADLACVTNVSGGCDYVIGTGSGGLSIDFRHTGSTMYAGKKVCIKNGTYTGGFWLYMARGLPNQPMTITNCGGQVIIKSTGTVLDAEGVDHFHITGTGSSSYFYGIVFWSQATDQAHHIVDLKNGATDGEIDHVEVRGDPVSSWVDQLDSNGVALKDAKGNNIKIPSTMIGGVGIAFRNYPLCNNANGTDFLAGSYQMSNFTQYNTKVHHTYVHDTGLEGMYIGTSHYGWNSAVGYNPGFPCSASSAMGAVRLWEPLLDGVDVHDNIVENTGNDGIQIGAAANGSNTFVRDNVVKNYGLWNNSSHSGGLMINPGSQGIWERNWIETELPRSTQGVSSHGMTGLIVRNNVIIGANVGFMMLRNSEYAMGVSNPGSESIYQNTVVDSADNAFQYYCGNYAANSLNLKNNLFSLYKRDQKGDDGLGSGCLNSLSSNGFYSTLSAAKFVDASASNYHLQSTSPGKDAGVNLSGIVDTDYSNQSRTGSYDFGAYTAP